MQWRLDPHKRAFGRPQSAFQRYCQFVMWEWVLLGIVVCIIIFFAIPNGQDRYSVDVSGRYVRNYKASKAEALPSVKQATGDSRGGLPNMAFFDHAKEHMIRDYILIIDRSGSMAGSNWAQARGAVESIAPYTVQFDPDGVTLIFFSSGYNKLDNIKVCF